jgi:Spy/CpxP family protein refolding chaperone
VPSPPRPSIRVGAVAACVVTAVLALVGPVAAGGMKFKWWQSDRFIRELGLTVDQQTRLDAIFKESWPSLEHCKTELDRLDRDLSRLIAEAADEPQVVQQIDRVESSRSALGKARSLMLYRMYRVLTPDQRVKLKALSEQLDAQEQSAKPPATPR